MSPPCKWKLCSLVSNTKPLPRALLETFVTHLFFCLLCSSSRKGTEQRWDFCVSLISFGLYTDSLNFFLGCSYLQGCLSFKHWNQFRAGCYNPLMFFWSLLLFFPTPLTPPFPANCMSIKPLEGSFC